MKQDSDKLYVYLIYAALVLATLIAFEPVRHNGFVDYDDHDYVTENPHVTDGINSKSVIWAFTSLHIANWHPLTWLSHMLDCQLFGPNPFWHHLTNLLFHIANTLLLFLILKKMTGAIWCSAFVAAAFALHPLHVESVAWVAERKDVLSGFFWMLTIAAYIRYVERPAIGRYVLVFLVFGLGLMAKPMMVTLPFVLLLLDYWPLDRMQQKSEDNTGLSIKHLIAEKIPLLVLVAASGTVTFIAQRIGGAMSDIDKIPLTYRMGNAWIAYISYITKMIYPARLAVLYPFQESGLVKWQLIGSFVILIVICKGIINTARRHRYLSVGWLWYLGTLVPVIGLVQVGAQTMADRYTYLPSIGIFIMAAWGANELLAKYRFRKIVLAISAGVVLTIWLICTRVQVSYWKDGLTLFEHALSVTKNNSIMHDNYGNELRRKDRFDEAIVHFDQAILINPQLYTAYINKGETLLEMGKIDESIAILTEALYAKKGGAGVYNDLGAAYFQKGEFELAIQNYKEALRLEPDHVKAIYNLGIVLQEQGRINETITKLEKVLQLKPDDYNAHYNIAAAKTRQGKYKDAVRHYNKALELKPDWPQAYCNLGNVYSRQSKFELAIQSYEKALRLEPDHQLALKNLATIQQIKNKQDKFNEAVNKWKKVLQSKPADVDAHLNLAMLMTEQKKYAEAVMHLKEILQLKPDSAYVLNNLAWIFATRKDGKLGDSTEAIQYAQRACRLVGYNQPDFLDTLAITYASAGRFRDAIATAEKAIKLAISTGKKELAEKIQKRLQSYKAGQPYRK